VPRRIGKGSRELDTAVGILCVQHVRVLNGQVGVEQLVGVFVGIRRGRFGAAKVNSVLVARDDCIDWGVLPSADTVEAKLVPVIRKRRGQVRREELGRDLADHRRQHTTWPRPYLSDVTIVSYSRKVA
jgi:hypothetical protein